MADKKEFKPTRTRKFLGMVLIFIGASYYFLLLLYFLDKNFVPNIQIEAYLVVGFGALIFGGIYLLTGKPIPFKISS